MLKKREEARIDRQKKEMIPYLIGSLYKSGLILFYFNFLFYNLTIITFSVEAVELLFSKIR